MFIENDKMKMLEETKFPKPFADDNFKFEFQT